MKFDGIMKDCRAALAFEDGLAEIVFATTAPVDTHAIDAANRVEQVLVSEGRSLRVVLYGWEELQNMIAQCDAAYALFNPSSVSTAAPQVIRSELGVDALAAAIAALLPTAASQSSGLVIPGSPNLPDGAREEDPGLHARIDVLRDLFSQDRQTRPAERKFLELLQLDGIETKPWALFRIHSNLGGIAMMSGREADAVARYEHAFSLRPGNSSAKANLSLARVFQGRYAEAMSLAREALSGEPRADHALGYLLQAAGRSDWQGDPEELVPSDLAGTIHADLGLADFYRRRNVDHWQHRSLELGRLHPGLLEFKPIVAVAVLSLAIDSGTIVAGGVGPVSSSEVSEAADGMMEYIDHVLDVGFADIHDRVAHISNTCVLLRLCGRARDAEGLLQRTITTVREDATLRRLMALAMTDSGRRDDAVRWLDGDPDAENRLLRADLRAPDDAEAALAEAVAVPSEGLPPRVSYNRWFTIAELALRLGRHEELRSAVDGLRAADTKDSYAEVFEARGAHLLDHSSEGFQRRLKAVAEELPEDADMGTRHFVASELRDGGLPEEASRLLDGRVDLGRLTPTAILYLNCLAAARRDSAFLTALREASPEMREHPTVLWTAAVHAWNMGDLERADEAVRAVIAAVPGDLPARILKLEILLRQDRTAEIVQELDQPLEELPSTRLRASSRLTTLLATFGYSKRASACAYKLFLENKDDPLSWMTIARLVFNDRNSIDRAVWSAPVVGPDLAVDLKFDDGGTRLLSSTKN